MAARQRRSMAPGAADLAKAETTAAKRGRQSMAPSASVPGGDETLAKKSRKPAVPLTAVAEASRPLTRSQLNAAQAGAAKKADRDVLLEALRFLETDTFDEATHVPSMYRLANGPLSNFVPPIREKGDASNAQFGADIVAEAVSFSSPFLVVNLGDRKGIWQVDPPLVRQLGEDPRKDRREVVSLAGDAGTAVAPAGLKNLGATCYLNSLLQYLFFNVDFRQSLLDIPSNSKVVQALQQVFALLAKGERNIVDPSEFVQAAGLDVVEQEDATEFSTLLLDWLERELGQQEGEARGGGFIPALFQGEISQFLTCLEHPEHTFERREPFYELRVRLTPSDIPSEIVTGQMGNGTLPPTVVGTAVGCVVAGEVAVAHSAAGQAEAAAAASGSRPSVTSGKRGSKKKVTPPAMVQLEQLLADTAFPDEMLDGSNQYHCPTCDRKVDARKSLRLARPPPYLNIIVERHHYDLQKGMRVKLNNPVSFPQRLHLRLCAPSNGTDAPTASPSSTVLPVMYECVGYLEHFSDSAHCGHYTATLHQENGDMAEGLKLVEDTTSPTSNESKDEQVFKTTSVAGPCIQDEPPSKRQCCDSADAAAGTPRQGMWWIMDDSTVSPVTWQPSMAKPVPATGPAEDNAAKPACKSPQRIESSSAYLLLYRRSDHSPGQFARSPNSNDSTRLPAELAAFVAAANKNLASEQMIFDERSTAVTSFLTERRQAVDGFVHALRSTITNSNDKDSGAAKFSIVPAAWLNAFLRGEDRHIEDLIEGDTRLAPLMYGRILLREPVGRIGQVVDPFAIWCGGVKLVPTAALDACGGRGGLDSSLFLSAQDALSPKICESSWNLARFYLKKWMLLEQILREGKVSLSDARMLHQKGRGEEIVWIATRIQKMWQKVVGNVSSNSAKAQPRQVMAMKAFLTEVQGVRWADQNNSEDDESGDATEGTSKSNNTMAPTESQLPVPTPVDRYEVNLTGGLICKHGLICRPRAACLVRRADILQLLDNSDSIEQAFKALWPDMRAVPRLRTGFADGRLLGFGDTCSECRSDACVSGMTTEPAATQRVLLVRRRYPSSKITRKVGNVALPDNDEPITGNLLRGLVQEQLDLPVARVIVVSNPEVGGAQEVDLQDDEVLCDTVESIVVEKDETSRPDREASAFQGSIFRGGGAAAT